MACTTMFTVSEFTHEFFEESSKAWKANKTRHGEGSYRYKKKAFPEETNLPAPIQIQTQTSKRRTEKELEKRHSIDEYAPPRVRRSSRLRGKEIKEIYESSEIAER